MLDQHMHGSRTSDRTRRPATNTSAARRRSWTLAAVVIVLVVLPGASAGSQSASRTAGRVAAARTQDADILGRWRFVRAVAAPWTVRGTPGKSDPRGWIGTTIQFHPDRVVGPGVLSCGRADYTPTRGGADALFQGSLPAPAARAAELLGLTDARVAGTSLNCDAGLFEFHRADRNTMLVALDDVIWTLDRSPGAFAPASAPAGVVQRLLERHFAGDMGFDATTVREKRDWLSDGLRTHITRYFAKPRPSDEVPPIDGDPFTDSQEYPTRFSVANGVVRGSHASVTVRFADGHRVRPVVFILRRDRGAWRVDDLRYESGETLDAMLRR
jgi:hypothetical protein